MIGNDIVDLNFAGINSRWREQRFLDKLFTKEEQLFISDNDCFTTIWRLWSMKESAYKIWSRNNASCFNPKFFNCKIISETDGIVSFDGQKVNTTTMGLSDVIYTTAHLKNINGISDIFVLEDVSLAEKNRLLKEKTIQVYSDLKSVSKASISIKKNEFGVPEFLICGMIQSDALTLTQHGKYGGFAMSYE